MTKKQKTIRIKAGALSLLLTSSKSISAYLQIGALREDMANFTNLTIRFDCGDCAKICGYPELWWLWDGDDDSQIEYCDAEYTITAKMEIKLLKKIKESIHKQSKDPMFISSCTEEYRAECLKKIDAAIEDIKARRAGNYNVIQTR